MSTSRSKIRVLIVEDHVALAENLFEFLGEREYTLDFASDGATALHLLATHQYDIVVLDVMLPGVSGFELCRRIRTDLQRATPIIMMTAKDQIEDKARAFSLGADDYLVKPFNLRELALRIHALHRRHQGLDSMLRAGQVSFDPGTLQVQVGDSDPLQLSGTAAHIFEALIRAYPNMVSYEQLGEMVWAGRDVESNTLRTHVYMLRKLLQAQFDEALIQTLHGRGYRLAPPDAAEA